MAQTARDAERDPSSVALLAASKTQDAGAIRALILQGQAVFGENRVQEAEEKWPALKKEFPHVKLHMIGHLQSNKAREAVALFDVIETLDRETLALDLAREMKRQNKNIPCLLQINTGDEPQKGGVAPREAEKLLALCRAQGLTVTGLMCIPPVDEPPELHFALIATLAGKLGLAELSIGMSHDFETAIHFGATTVRIGTALFGPRPQAPHS